MLEEVQDLGNPVPIILGVIGTIVVAFFAGRLAGLMVLQRVSYRTAAAYTTVLGSKGLACIWLRLAAAAAC